MKMQYFELRFSKRLRTFGAALYVCKAIVWMPIAIYVPAMTFNQVSGIDIYKITPIVIILCTFYTTIGGYKGVVWTDVLQSIIMYGSMIVLMIKGTWDLGGLENVWQRNLDGGRINAPTLSWDPTVRLSMLSVLIGGTVFKIQGTAINQPAVQRFMSLPTLKMVKRAMILFISGLILLYLTCVYVGLLTYATFYDCDPLSTGLAKKRDQVVPLLVMNVLGIFPGFPGLFVSAVFSAALSSLSTILNSLSAVILEDFFKPNVKKPLTECQTAIIMRTVVVVFGFISLFSVYIVDKLGMVLQLSATIQSALYGPMLGIFTVGMLMPWINEKSILAGSSMSFLFMAWICVNAQIDIAKGNLRHEKLPVSIEGCDYQFDIGRYLNSTTELHAAGGNAIHHMSFLWYSLCGATLTIVFANCAILVFGKNKIENVDKKLLSPFVARYFEKHESVVNKLNLIEKVELLSKKKQSNNEKL